jgi:hypothetical protein
MNQDKSQNVWAQYSMLPPPKIQLRRFDSRGSRFYYWKDDEGIKTGIGVTTLLDLSMPENKNLTAWKLRTPNWENVLRLSINYGNLMHELFQTWMWKKCVDKDVLSAAKDVCEEGGKSQDMPEKDLLAWMSFCEEYEVEPLLIEAMLISPPIQGNNYYCQAIDSLIKLSISETVVETKDEGVYKSGPRKGQMKITETKTKTKVRKTAALDWKSNYAGKEFKSFFDSHKFQLMGAKRAIEHNYPDITVDLLINWSPVMWRTQPNYEMKTWGITELDEQRFDNYINTGLLEGYFTPSGNIFVCPEFSPTTKSTDYELLDYVSFVERYLLNAPEEPYIEEVLPDSILSKI